MLKILVFYSIVILVKSTIVVILVKSTIVVILVKSTMVVILVKSTIVVTGSIYTKFKRYFLWKDVV